MAFHRLDFLTDMKLLIQVPHVKSVDSVILENKEIETPLNEVSPLRNFQGCMFQVGKIWTSDDTEN